MTLTVSYSFCSQFDENIYWNFNVVKTFLYVTSTDIDWQISCLHVLCKINYSSSPWNAPCTLWPPEFLLSLPSFLVVPGKKKSTAMITDGNAIFIITNYSLWGFRVTHMNSRRAIIAVCPLEPWFSFSPVTAICSWLPPRTRLPRVALQRKGPSKTNTTSAGCDMLLYSSTMLDGTYRNAIVSREPRYAGHSLQSENSHTLKKIDSSVIYF